MATLMKNFENTSKLRTSPQRHRGGTKSCEATEKKLAKPHKISSFEVSKEGSEKSVATLFEDVVKTLPDLERKKMFGWTCVFANGNMLGGYYQNQMMLRLSEQDREKFLELPGATHFNPKGNRPMLEYLDVPQQITESPTDLKRWFDRGFKYVAGLPPKAKKVARGSLVPKTANVKEKGSSNLRGNSRNRC
jgi:TfoX/Sxy family transcriptional regulator of competence genes